jgi:hypothetical protein
MSVSDSTKKAYEGRLTTFEGYITCYMIREQGQEDYEYSEQNWVDNLKFLAFSDKYKNPETKKGVISALLWKIGNKESEPYKKTHEAFDRVKQECIKKAREQTLPDNRKSKYLTKDQLLECYSLCHSKYLSDQQDYYEHLILALYIIQPPVRADYCGMEIWDSALPSYMPQTNYCQISAVADSFFVFQKYKTSKTYGKVIVKIEPPLVELLKHHFYERKEKYVLPDFWSQNMLSEKVRAITKKYTGKECSIGLIRHAWVFDLYKTNPTLLEKEDLARKMLHSVAVQELYRTSEDLHILNLEE